MVKIMGYSCVRYFLFFMCLTPWTVCGLNFLTRPYEILVGPEVYHLERRVTEGGHQKGLLGGGRARIERIHPCSLYIGLEGWSAAGQLKGDDSTHAPMDSTITDAQVEGRLGYTTFTRYCPSILFTVFFGYGKFFSWNRFSKDFRLPVTFKNEFEFFSAGIKTRAYIQEGISIGCDLKLKSMFEGIRWITDDPNQDDVSIRMGDELQYSFDFPFQAVFCVCGRRAIANITPFYRFRHYGYQAHATFDFFDTQFHIFGCRFLAGIEF